MRYSLLAPLLLGVACLSLTGCDDSDKPPKVYTSLEECKAELTEAECVEGMQKAADAHAASAPHYQAQATCEETYGPGNCVPRRNEAGDSFFMPFMMGWMMGGGSGTRVYSPIYVDRSGYAYSGSGRIGSYSAPSSGVRSSSGFSVSRGGLGSSASSIHSSPSVAATPSSGTVSRGGFGSTASSAAMSGGE